MSSTIYQLMRISLCDICISIILVIPMSQRVRMYLFCVMSLLKKSSQLTIRNCRNWRENFNYSIHGNLSLLRAIYGQDETLLTHLRHNKKATYFFVSKKN